MLETLCIQTHLSIPGGAPDLNRFTGDRFNESFNGCIYVIENPDTSRAVPLQDFAIRTVNVDVCDEYVFYKIQSFKHKIR